MQSLKASGYFGMDLNNPTPEYKVRNESLATLEMTHIA
jgi:hypothetical protein